MGILQFHTHGQPRKISPDDEIIEFVCNENLQFGIRVKLD